MATLKEVCSKLNDQYNLWNLLGASGKWVQQVTEGFQNVGRIFMEENNINPEEFANVSLDTTLGPKAEQAYQKVVEMLDAERIKQLGRQ